MAKTNKSNKTQGIEQTDKEPIAKTYTGKEAWKKLIENHFRLTIPNKPFAGEPVKFTAKDEPPPENYRECFTQEEKNLLKKALPPEIEDKDIALEALLRRIYGMKTEDLKKLNIENIKDYLKDFLPKDLMTLTVTITKYNVHPSTIRRAIKDGKLKNYSQDSDKKNAPILISESEVKGKYPPLK